MVIAAPPTLSHPAFTLQGTASPELTIQDLLGVAMHVSTHGRIPRARIDPIVTADQALSVFKLAMSYPLAPETLVMFLDGANRGHELVSVSGTHEPLHVIDVAETMAMSASASTDLAGLVLVTIRPDGDVVDGSDDDLWFELDDVVEFCGMLLIDWFIITPWRTHCPREELGVASRWPG